MDAAPPAVPRWHARVLRAVCLSISVVLLALATYATVARPDALAAITVFPVWLWAALGILIVAPWSVRGKASRRRPFLAVGVLWVIYVAALAEEPRCVFRSLIPGTSPASGAHVRVISLNCAGGDPEAAAEVAAFRPDIVLLQESPPAAKTEEIARKLFGQDAACLAALDPSIMIRGTLEAIPLPRGLSGSFVYGRARLASGITLDLASLRLTPAIFRMDLWSPDCWRSQTENRMARRRMLQAFADVLAAQPPDRPLILAGDFNAPQGDAIFRLLRPRLHDAFSQGGTGWGNTITNDLPALRIDQVWMSSHLSCVSAVAYRTIHSDHRMLVCDLEVDHHL